MNINDFTFDEPSEFKHLTFEVYERKLDKPIVWDNSAELLADGYEPPIEGSIEGRRDFASDVLKVAIAKGENGEEIGRIAVLTNDVDDWQTHAMADSFFDGYEPSDDGTGFTVYAKVSGHHACMVTAYELTDMFFALY